MFRENARNCKAHRAKSRAKTTPSAAPFKNCVEEPAMEGDDEEFIINDIAPPELHLHTGSVNKHAREINKKWRDNQFYKWCARKNIQVENYFRNELNGNACKNVLEKLDDLEFDLMESGPTDLEDILILGLNHL